MMDTLKKWYNDLKRWQRVVIIVATVLVLCGILCPRGYKDPAMYAKFGVGLGPLRGNINIEAYENGDAQGYEVGAEPTCVLFYAPWCGYCKDLMPIYDEVAKKNPDKSIIKLNCDENKELAKKHDITSYPTIKYLSKGVKDVTGAVVYTGERTVDALDKWVKQVLQ
jgi:protein disulfide-isomerase-like protein